MKYVSLAVAGMLLLSACSEQKSGIETVNFDKTVPAQDDFYRYVNGTWLKNTAIPADKSNYGSFTALADQAQKDLRSIIEESAAAVAPKGDEKQLIGDLYASFMDSASVESAGLNPLKEELDRIASIKTNEDLASQIAYLSKLGVQTPLALYVTQDEKNPEMYLPYLFQSGLGLPDRDYYFADNEKFAGYRTAYQEFLKELLNEIKYDNAEKVAADVFNLEKEIASHHWTRVESRDRDKTYNKVNHSSFIASMKNFDLKRWIEGQGIVGEWDYVVSQPSFLTGLDEVIRTVPVDTWKAYLTVKLLSNSAPFLYERLAQINFNFYGKTLRGVEQMQPRWKRGVDLIDNNLGEAAGKVYVSRHFKPEAKKRMNDLVANLKEAMKVRIEKLEWMSEQTKQEAQAKLAGFTTKIGYPDKWKDYSALTIERNDLFGNLKRSAIFQHEDNIGKLGKPVDKTEWFMTPQTVNAYYNPVVNEIVFPAAILQPPFFNLEADDAVNYGAIGAVIGHEISHGFDDQGRKSDGKGVLRDWWTEADAAEYNKRADQLVGQFDQYSPIDTLKINGRFTLGENIGDLAGLTIALEAYRLSLKGEKPREIDGFTGEQRFFLGWAQIWRRNYRDDELRNRLVTDPHSPSEYRVNGIVKNIPEFYQAFNVTEGNKLYLPDSSRVKIW